MAAIADVYRALNAMQNEGIVEKYAVCGGMAALFYAETTRTYDIDIFVLIPQSGLLVDLSRIYNWARERGYKVEQEYLRAGGSKRRGRVLDLMETEVEMPGIDKMAQRFDLQPEWQRMKFDVD